MKFKDTLLSLAVEQAEQLYKNQREGDGNPELNHWEMVTGFGKIYRAFNSGDYHKGQREANILADRYNLLMPSILVQFREKCRDLESWV